MDKLTFIKQFILNSVHGRSDLDRSVVSYITRNAVAAWGQIMEIEDEDKSQALLANTDIPWDPNKFQAIPTEDYFEVSFSSTNGADLENLSKILDKHTTRFRSAWSKGNQTVLVSSNYPGPVNLESNIKFINEVIFELRTSLSAAAWKRVVVALNLTTPGDLEVKLVEGTKSLILQRRP